MVGRARVRKILLAPADRSAVILHVRKRADALVTE